MATLPRPGVSLQTATCLIQGYPEATPGSCCLPPHPDAGTLTQHLIDTNEAALNMMETLVKQMAKAEGVTEQMKATDQMKWVGLMNSIRQAAEETVLAELIYS